MPRYPLALEALQPVERERDTPDWTGRHVKQVPFLTSPFLKDRIHRRATATWQNLGESNPSVPHSIYKTK